MCIVAVDCSKKKMYTVDVLGIIRQLLTAVIVSKIG